MAVNRHTSPALSTVVVVHDWALALPAASRLTMITNMADKIILLFIMHLPYILKITIKGAKKQLSDDH